jgi:hypothetical protein
MTTNGSSRATLLGIERILASQNSQLNAHIRDGAGQSAFRWLNASDMWINLRNAIEKRQPGTGEWLTSSADFQAWLSSPQFLWVTGIPGAGKTILSSTVIATLLCQQETTKNAVVFSYFDFQDSLKQQADTLLRAVLTQLAARNSEALQCLVELHGRCTSSRGASPDELLRAVATSLTAFPKTFIIVDAMDECSDRRLLLQHLKALSELPNVHLAAFSRKETDIESALQDVAHEIRLTAAAVDNDIAMYVKHRMETSEDMVFWAPEDKERAQKHLTSKADGM